MLITCEHCHDDIHGKKFTVNGHMVVCGECIKEYHKCDKCKTLQTMDFIGVDREGKTLCEDCIDSHYFHCYVCHLYVHHNDIKEYGYNDEHDFICKDCVKLRRITNYKIWEV